jgi:hypothetical protein
MGKGGRSRPPGSPSYPYPAPNGRRRPGGRGAVAVAGGRWAAIVYPPGRGPPPGEAGGGFSQEGGAPFHQNALAGGMAIKMIES